MIKRPKKAGTTACRRAPSTVDPAILNIGKPTLLNEALDEIYKRRDRADTSDDEELMPWRSMTPKLNTTMPPPWANTTQNPKSKDSVTLSKVAYVDLYRDDDEGQSIKKNDKDDNSSSTKDYTEFQTEEKAKLKKLKLLIKSLDETTRELFQIVANNQNTKKKLKRPSLNLEPSAA